MDNWKDLIRKNYDEANEEAYEQMYQDNNPLESYTMQEDNRTESDMVEEYYNEIGDKLSTYAKEYWETDISGQHEILIDLQEWLKLELDHIPDSYRRD